MVERTYEGALEELNGLLKLQRDFSLPPLHVRMDMQRAYLRASGCTLDDLDKLNIVHVAGSKGKGSTCAYIESMFRHEGYRTGLITSPHLINVEERIRVDGEPVGRDLFAEHFWLLYDKFSENAVMHMWDAAFKCRQLLSCLSKGSQCVDIIVFVGNVRRIPRAVVFIVHSPYGLQYFRFKEGGSGGGGSRFGRKIRPDQRCKSTSRHRGVRHRTGTHRHFGRYCAEGGVEQGWNFQGSIGVPTLALCPTRKQIDGIASTHVVGRFHEVRMSERLTFFVDCAHTAESVEHCSKWFQTVSPASSSDAGHRALRILIFTVTGNRNPLVMLRRLETLRFDVVYFAGFIASSLARVGPKLPCPCDCKTVWEELASSTPSYELVGDQLVQFLKSLKTWDGTSPLTLNFGTVKPRGIHVLVTGSVYLVGDVLSALRPEYSITWT